MITLFGSLDSGNVHKVQLILRRVGIDYHRVELEDYPAIRAWLERVETQPGLLSMSTDGAVRTFTFDEYFCAGSA